MKIRTGGLRGLAPDLWCVDLDAYDKGLHVQTRMSVVRLGGSKLLLYSPVDIDDATHDAIRGLGTVAWIVAPNLGHHMFAAGAARRFPEARVLGCPGLSRKRPDLPFDGEVSAESAAWAGELEVFSLAGTPRINEVALHHAPTGSLLCADLLLNVSRGDTRMTRLLFRALGVWHKPGQTRMWKWWTKDHAGARASLEPLLERRIDRIVMAHGDVLEEGAAGVLRSSLSWLRVPAGGSGPGLLPAARV